MNRIRPLLHTIARFFHLESWLRLLLLCILTGIVAGFGALVFDITLEALSNSLLFSWLFNTGQDGYWLLLVVPALGALAGGLLAAWLAPEAAGHGTDAVILSFHKKKGYIRPAVPVVKGISSILTIGTGGSAGKEGPIAQIGAGFGSTVGSLLRLSVYDRRILMLAGVAGGIGSIFKAPLAGAFFAAEVLYRDPVFEHDAIIPGFFSSVTAYSVFTMFRGYGRILELENTSNFRFPSHGGSAVELLHYALLSLLCTLVAYMFVKVLHVFETRIFKPLPLHRALKPGLGGAAVGALAILLVYFVTMAQSPSHQTLGASHPSHIMSGGYEYLQAVLDSALDTQTHDPMVSFKLAAFLGLVVGAKMVATACTVGSGGSGGLLFPALFLGGITGATYAKLLRAFSNLGWIPQALQMTPGARASMILVGMGGVFAACTKTPIASLIMVSEITGSYGLLVPLMLTCASAYLLSRSFTINSEQVNSIVDSPAHRGEFLVNVLEDVSVADAITPGQTVETIREDTSFTEVMRRIKHSSKTVFPVVNDDHHLVGIFSLSDIRQIMTEPLLGNLVLAGELGTRDVITVTYKTNLNDALRKLTQINATELPVVEIEPNPETGQPDNRRRRVVAMLSRKDLITAYQHRLTELQLADQEEDAAVLRPR